MKRSDAILDSLGNAWDDITAYCNSFAPEDLAGEIPALDAQRDAATRRPDESFGWGEQGGFLHLLA